MVVETEAEEDTEARYITVVADEAMVAADGAFKRGVLTRTNNKELIQDAALRRDSLGCFLTYRNKSKKLIRIEEKLLI